MRFPTSRARGRMSRHNLKYWTDGDWLGFGCGAHSTRGGVRWKNVSATDEYVERVRAGKPLEAERRLMSRQEQFEDALFTGLRLTEGVDLEAVGARYGQDPWAGYGRALEPFVQEGLLCHEKRRLFLTRRGMLVANEIMRVFV